MYRLLAIAKYEDRYVIPTAHAEAGAPARGDRPGCSSTTTAARAWAARGRSARRPARRRRRGRDLPRAAATGRPPTRRPPGRPAAPGQPAQLGRQGIPRRTVPARRDAHAERGRRSERPRDRRPGRSAVADRRAVAAAADTRTSELVGTCRCCADAATPCRTTGRTAAAVPRPPGGAAPADRSCSASTSTTFDLRRRCCLYLTYYPTATPASGAWRWCASRTPTGRPA